MHSAVPRALHWTEQAKCKGCYKAGISTAAVVSTFYCVCSFSLSHTRLSCLACSACVCIATYRNKYRRWVHVLTHPFLLKYGLFSFACVLLCVYSICHSMCGRVDRPSAPLWQMKVMLRRRDAWRKAGNKQPDLWRTLKNTSERKQGGRRGEKTKQRKDRTE